jgi:hypothetical protein
MSTSQRGRELPFARYRTARARRLHWCCAPNNCHALIFGEIDPGDFKGGPLEALRSAPRLSAASISNVFAADARRRAATAHDQEACRRSERATRASSAMDADAAPFQDLGKAEGSQVRIVRR